MHRITSVVLNFDGITRRIICVEPAKERQGIAKHSGADNIVDPTKEDVAEVCMKLTDVSNQKQPKSQACSDALTFSSGINRVGVLTSLSMQLVLQTELR